jgi:hypothetical protein
VIIAYHATKVQHYFLTTKFFNKKMANIIKSINFGYTKDNLLHDVARMALMKVGSKIKIPKRQFIGESKMLMNELDKQLQVKI